MFQVVTGKEKYKVTDLTTGGEAFMDDKIMAYKHSHIIVAVLQHPYRIECRNEAGAIEWQSEGGHY